MHVLLFIFLVSHLGAGDILFRGKGFSWYQFRGCWCETVNVVCWVYVSWWGVYTYIYTCYSLTLKELIV